MIPEKFQVWTPEDKKEFERLKARAQPSKGIEFNTDEEPRYRAQFRMWVIRAYYKGDFASVNLVDEFNFKEEFAANAALAWLRELQTP